MPNTIRLRRGTTTPTAGSFVDGEPAWDSTNSKLYVKNTAGSMVQIGDAVLSANNAFTGSCTHYNSTGQIFGTATAANDGIILQGRAGGTSSFRSTLIPGTLTASRTLTLPDVSGTVITTGDTGTVTGTMIAANTIIDSDIATNAAIAGTKISPNFGSQNVVTTGSLQGALSTISGTASTAPITISGAGVLTSGFIPGTIEYDGTHFYSTPTTTSGRGQIPAWQTFRLTADGANIGGTTADFFGATSAINLAATSVYDIEIFAYCTKNTAGTISWNLTASSAPTAFSGVYQGSPVAGMGAGTPITGYTGQVGTATGNFPATASVTNNVRMSFSFKVQVVTNLATTFKLRVTCSAGTVTPLTGSFYTVRQIAGTTGSFA